MHFYEDFSHWGEMTAGYQEVLSKTHICNFVNAGLKIAPRNRPHSVFK